MKPDYVRSSKNAEEALRESEVRYQIAVEDQQAREKELEQYAARLALINDMSSKIAALLELDSLLKRSAQLVQETFGYHHVALFLLDGKVVRLKAIAGSYKAYFPPTHSQQLSQGIIGWVATHGEKVIANDVRSEPRYTSLIADYTETRAELCLPIKLAGQTMGVLDIQSPRLNTFDQNDVIAMDILTDQIAVAIENARLYERAQQELAERKQAEEALRQSEQRFRQVVSSISDHIYVTEVREEGPHINIYLSPHVESLTGYPWDKFIADWTFWPTVVIHPDDQVAAAAQAARLTGGENSEVEYRIIRADGEMIWVRDSGRVEKDGARQSLIIYGVVSDITARKRAEEALQRAHVQNEQLLASISSILIGVNADDHITHWNRPTEMALGISAATVIGQPFLTCNIPWDWHEILKCISDCRKKGQPAQQSDIRYTRTDGTAGFLNVTVAPFVGDTSEQPGFLLLGEEITEHKILEGQLVQAQKLEAIGQLAAGIAHEINTPTQYIGDNVTFFQTSFGKMRQVFEKQRHLLYMAKSGGDLTELVAELENIVAKTRLDYLLEEIPLAIEETLEGVNRVTQIVQAMKNFSHPGVEEKTSLNINQAIESTITVARNEWKYVAEVETNLDPDLPPVLCLPGEFNQAILNVLINAAHAIADEVGSEGERKGRITIITRRERDWVEIRISDTGTGIPVGVREKIFNPFFTTKPVGRGTGQGLAIAHAVIVEKHGGTITFETKLGQGTTFIIRLPTAPTTQNAEQFDVE